MWWWLLVGCGRSPVEWCREDPAFDEVIAQLDATMSIGDVPGAQLAIAQDGVLVCSEAVGVRGVDDTTPVGRETRFSFGSITKMFTALDAATLADRGDLDLQAPITGLVPELSLDGADDPGREDPSAITLELLLSMQSGLTDDYQTEQSCPGMVDLQAFALAPKRVDTPPGLAWHYANPAFAVAGLAIERADGRDYADSVDKRVVKPLDLDRVTWDAEEVADDGDYATGYYPPDREIDQGIVGPGDWHCPGWAPAAGAWGTATDLAELALDLTDGTIDPAIASTVTDPRVDTRQPSGVLYGLGMFSLAYNQDPTHVFIGHDGRWNGFLTEVVMVPDQGFALAVLFNSDSEGPGSFAVDAMATLLGWGPPLPTWEPSDPDTWDDFVGTWTYDGDYDLPGAFTSLEVWRDRDHLYGSKDGGETLQFIPADGDYFQLPDGEDDDADDVVFWRPETGGRPEWLVSRGWSARRDE